MSITKSAVIQTASEIADERGLNNVSLKTVAERLNIRTPSLYNHIESLEDLLRNVAHTNMKIMNERMMQAAIGVSGDDAVKAVGITYLDFMIEHPGIYETIQWATWNGTEETAEIFTQYKSLLTTLIRSCNIRKKNAEEALNILTGILHGYTTLRLKEAISDPEKIRKSLSEALDVILLGLHQKYGK